MKNKMFCLAIIICSLFGVRCTEDQKMDNLYPDYIEINFNNSNYQANLQLFIKASKRFNEHVYKDKNNVYKTSINKGSDIRISEDLFSLLTKSLKYQEQIKMFNNKINSRIDSINEKLPITKSYPDRNYDAWVAGQLSYLWNKIIGTWQGINEGMVNFFCITVGITVASLFEYFFLPIFGFGSIIPPDIPYRGYTMYAGQSFPTYLPDGLYPYNSFFGNKQYVAVRNGVATVKNCRYGEFNWYRSEHLSLTYFDPKDGELLWF